MTTRYTVTLDLIGHDGRDELERQIKHYLPDALNIQIEDSEQSVLEGLIRDVRVVDAYVRNNAVHDWENKYDQVFGMKIWQRIKEAGYYFTWSDPDASYKDDVCAYVGALVEWADKMERGNDDNDS